MRAPHGGPWSGRIVPIFFGVSAQIMRRILVDAARTRASVKRGARLHREEHSAAVDFDQIPGLSSTRDRELIAVDGSLEVLWVDRLGTAKRKGCEKIGD